MWNIQKNSGFQNNQFFFYRFDDWKDFMTQGNQALTDAMQKYGKKFESYFKEYNYGSVPSQYKFRDSDTIEKLNSGFYTVYMEEQLLNNVVLAFDEILANIDMGGSFKKSKLIITEKTTGIFDFGLASLGLYTEKEFYSEKLAEDSPLEFPTEPKGVVPPMFVTQNQLGDFWYVSLFSGKKYKMTRQDKGTQRAIDDGFLPNQIPTDYKTFKTTQKKSYVTFKKEGGKAKMVDLYVGVGGLGGMSASGMLQRALPMFMAARFFESVGIRTRINASRMWAGYGGEMNGNRSLDDTYNNITITIKDFGEDLDFTRLALAVADERTYRYNIWKLAPAISAMNYGVAIKGAGRTIYGGREMDETAARYKNWYYDQIENNNKEWVEVAKPLMIYGGVPEPKDSWKYTGDKNERGYKDVVKEFFRILDVVDFYYNDPYKAAERIYQRFVESGQFTVSEYRDYVGKTLSEAFGVAIGGKYADPQADIDKNEDKFDEKIDGLNTFLQGIK